MVHISKMFANPEMMPEDTLRKFTGLRAKQFWELIDEFVLSGLRPGKHKLNYAGQVLLHLMKIRKGVPSINEVESFLRFFADQPSTSKFLQMISNSFISSYPTKKNSSKLPVFQLEFSFIIYKWS